MNKHLPLALLGVLSVAVSTSNYAAKPINLSHATVNTLLPSTDRVHGFGATLDANLAEVSREQDAKGNTHIHIKQLYQGIPVWHANAVLHIPAGQDSRLSALLSSRGHSALSMNGLFYEGLSDDLPNFSAATFNAEQQTKALNATIKQFFTNRSQNTTSLSEKIVKPIIFTDKTHKAHAAFLISFMAKTQHAMPKNPHYIIDAKTLHIYHTWDEVKTLELVKGGGLGGNEGLVGKLTYDGGQQHFPALTISRDMRMEMCYLKNAQLIVIDNRTGKIPQFSCKKTDASHQNVYWNTNNDYENGGYSPNNDALYSDYIVRKMYMDWFDVTMLRNDSENKNDRTPWRINMLTHMESEGQNAWWNHGTMGFGNGDDESYPVVAPSVVAHELSHGFTEQQSQLVYMEESGGLNESFSDMADKAVEYYVHGTNTWTIDPELLKPGGRLLRYMDEPTKDCADGQKPGDGCSIASYKDYNDMVNVHHSSGIFNRAFYLLAQKWDTKKAFEVMVYANRFYWTPTTTFQEAACGVIAATKFYRYDVAAIKDVMQQVDVDTTHCK